MRRSGIADAPEADMPRGAAYLLSLAGRRPVAQAVRRRTQVRAALDHPAGVLAQRRGVRGAAAGLGPAVLDVRPAARGPLPDVAGDVVEPVAVGREPPDRRGALEAVRAQVFPWESAEPAVGHDPASGFRVLAPGVRGLVEPPAGGVLPLGLGRQPTAGPGGVGGRVLVTDVHDRVQLTAVQRRA